MGKRGRSEEMEERAAAVDPRPPASCGRSVYFRARQAGGGLRLLSAERLRPVVLVCSKADLGYVREKSPNFTWWSSPREGWFLEGDELPLGSGVHQGLQI